MKKEYKLALHIFRRDLRLQDNTALINALQKAELVIPCFIFDTRQVGNKNKYRSINAIQFMVQSLQELDHELQKKKSKLYLFKGTAEEIISKLIKKLPIDLVVFNKDYTPFSKKRDKKIESLCKKQKVLFQSYHDALLLEPKQSVKSDGNPYTIYTPFFKKNKSIKIPQAKTNRYSNYYTKPIKDALSTTEYKKMNGIENKNIKVQGGRKEGLHLLKKAQKLNNYKTLRNIPSKDHTTHLSAHNKFGTLSIREVYHAFKKAKQNQLIAELYWRDFFTTIIHHFPIVLKKAFKEKFRSIKWKTNKKHLAAWQSGMTGFPIVDAGMRELNETGFIHNRVRMITASFLIKDLHINWKKGEQYFAQKLIDYDPAVNNGNWQWAASTGCDAQPYFRIFNPWLQQKKFDPDCTYIKKWVPELKHLKPNEIHNIYKEPLENINYPKPIVNHQEQVKHTKKMYY